MSQQKEIKQSALTKAKSQKPAAKKGPRPTTRPQGAPSQMRSALSTLFNFSTQRSRGDLADLAAIGEEGVDHINVHRSSKTELGHLLSTAAELDFLLFGKRFTSIDNLMMFYRSYCTVEALTTGPVGLVREFNRNSVEDYPSISNLFVVVCLGYVEIFKRNPALTEAMAENRLPLDSYFTEHGKRKRHKATTTLVQAVQEAFNAVRDKREPDLNKFMFPDFSRKMNTRATMEGKSLLEVVHSEFSPRAVREKFLENHADLANKIRQKERDRIAARRANREAAVKKDEAPVELGDAADIIKQQEADIRQIAKEVKETNEAVEQEVARLVANTSAVADPVEADGVTKVTKRTDDTVDFERPGIQNAAPNHDQLGTVDNSDPIAPAAPITK